MRNGQRIERNDQRAFDFAAAAQFDIAGAELGGEVEALVIERRARDDVDVAGDGFAVEIGRHCLLDDDLRGDGRRDRIEASVAAFGRDDENAIERQGRPVERGAAQVDIARLALVALDTDAGQAADGLGDILVGQATDCIGGQDTDQAVGIALDFKRRGLGFGNRAAAGDDDFVFITSGIRRFGGGRHLYNLGRGGGAGEGSKADATEHRGAGGIMNSHFGKPLVVRQAAITGGG